MHLTKDGEWLLTTGPGRHWVGRLVLEPTLGPIVYRGDGRYRAAGIHIAARVEPAGAGCLVTFTVDMPQETPITYLGIEFGSLHLTPDHLFYGHVPGFLHEDGVRPALTARSEGWKPAMVAMLVPSDGPSLLAGMGGLHADSFQSALQGDNLRTGFAPERNLEGTQQFRCFFALNEDPLRLLLDYGAFLAALGRKPGPVTTGWNSWDFYGGAVTMQDIETEMHAIDELSVRQHLQFVTVDMGWETDWGDWQFNRHFPADPSEVAARIRAHGRRPGLWTAPLQVGMYTPLARHRQDLFLRNREGGLIVEQDAPRGPVLLLDYSLPEVCEQVAQWFMNWREAGFELFKIDYLYEKYLRQSKHCAGRLGKIEFARRIFRTIRRAAGPGAHLINCGGSKEAALGLVDSSRVSMDIHTFWGHIRNNARQAANSFWMHRNLWVNDPDFAIIRHADNCTAPHRNMPYTPKPAESDGDFWMRGPEATAGELRTWLSVIRLNGGSLFLSDSIDALDPAGQRLLEKLFPPLETGFLPLDLFTRTYPRTWLSRDPGRPTLGLFNWEDSAQAVALPPEIGPRIKGRDFWTGNPVAIQETVTLPPHSDLLLALD